MTCLILEGPEHEIMRGFRHVQIVMNVGGAVRTSSCIAQPWTIADFARQLRGRLYRAGEWESNTGDMRRLNRFPAPRPEILDELFHEKQREFAA